LKIKTRHSRKANVQDQTTFAAARGGIHEIFCRLESDGMIAGRSEQPLQGPPDGLVIIDHIHRD
jgi:hypothetical protein